jgi:hypothetical protein
MPDPKQLSVSRGFAVVVLVSYFTVAGAAIVSTVNTRKLQKRLQAAEAGPAQQPPVALFDLNGEVAALRQALEKKTADYIRLETDYRQLQAESQAKQIHDAQNPAAAPAPPAARDATPALSWLERIRRDDPERYRQIQQARDQRRQRVEEWYKEQFARLDERLQIARSEVEADLVNEIADALARVNELRQRWAAIRETPEPERTTQADQLRAETREASQTLRELRSRDRQMQLDQLAREIGYRTDTAAAEFVDRVESIYRETQTNPWRGQFWGSEQPAP